MNHVNHVTWFSLKLVDEILYGKPGNFRPGLDVRTSSKAFRRQRFLMPTLFEKAREPE